MKGEEQPVEITSPNFGFLTAHDPALLRYAAQAELYFADDPNTALIKLRQFAEAIAKEAAARMSVWAGAEAGFADVLFALRNRGAVPGHIGNLFHGVRKAGNRAAHEGWGDHREALHQLKSARRIALWFHRAFGPGHKFEAGPFVPPPNPRAATEALIDELEQLRSALGELHERAQQAGQRADLEAEARTRAEQDAARAYADLEAALELAEQTEQELADERAFQRRLAELQVEATAHPAGAQQAVEAAAAAAQAVELDEAETRTLIDGQLQELGWEADSVELRWSKGTRPMKGRNLAIAEVPTDSGPADYILYLGLRPVGVIEAKRQATNVSAVLEQAKRYARDYTVRDGDAPVGPFGEYRLPFAFATNGRPYSRQFELESGIWFVDKRVATNLPRALQGWYSPEGLQELLRQDVGGATRRLADESMEHLPLRAYQRHAIEAIEAGIAEGRRSLMLAMATGTGKTRTCIALIYRLIKTRRFRRVLFLVDRTALGEQAADAFESLTLEGQRSFSQIFDVKRLGDLRPDGDTRLQIATVQGMVARLLRPADDAEPLPVDAYDCIVVDECHRGYLLDRELSPTELTFRSEADYVSKYRRVLDWFDAVKIGLTATPALHTTEIFGKPVFTYGYRQAVIDGHLIDHEPPLRIVTQLSEDGIHFEARERVLVYKVRHNKTELAELPDELDFEVAQFNRGVITEGFNRVVCERLAHHIDPSLPAKTLVFCANDLHADLVVKLLREAFARQYGSVREDAVVKITGRSDRPMKLFRRFKNEPQQLKVVVTVDLLTTGIDVPAISNLVFIRRVRSRILYDQMLGRATRRCDEIGKETFRIFDAVDLYAHLADHSDMKPVVANPRVTFAQLVEELSTLADGGARGEVRDQLVAKLQRRKKRLVEQEAEAFEAAAGQAPEPAVAELQRLEPAELAAWFQSRPLVVPLLDQPPDSEGRFIPVSQDPDRLLREERGYGTGSKPEDYLESFGAWIAEHRNAIPALIAVTTKPRALTRQQLRELKLQLDAAGFTEARLQVAWRESTNQDIAASIVGFIRQQALGSPLLPYDERVDAAVKRILGTRDWSSPQRHWLERIAKQLKKEVVVDRAAFDRGAFAADGGFRRLNRVFDGRLEAVLDELNDAVWEETA